ncbi:hypothetical protein VNO78_25860 [Psophocarpus tetragonolobus]|uniref:LCR-like protein n=1 Tax=Psophocarpus tetragonolobus TaxID=3891 RepID=A0AAN9S8I6_PSOTE
MTTRRINSLSFVLGILCIALLLVSGSARIVCSKGGNCPNAKACYNYCVFLGYKDYGGLCTTNGTNLCCCIKEGDSLHDTP